MQTITTIVAGNATPALSPIPHTRLALCEETGCTREATSFDTDRLMFVCAEHQAIQALRQFIEQHFPWLRILGIIDPSSPMIAVNDTTRGNLCTGFRTQADLAAYLTLFAGKEAAHAR